MNPELRAQLESLGDLFIDSKRLIYKNVTLRNGGFADVKPAELVDDGPARHQKSEPSLVAVKHLRRSVYHEGIIVELVREIRAWKDLNNRFILPLSGFFLSDDLDEALLISPWKANGNLSDYLRANDPPMIQRLWFVVQTLNAVSYMHNVDLQVAPNDPKGIIHGDIKPANMLIDDNLDVVICDVGLSLILRDAKVGEDEIAATTRWSSPERLEGSLRTKAGDMWAWACVATEIITGRIPYEGISSDLHIIKAIFIDKVTPLPRSYLEDPVNMWPVISPCWSYDASERPSAEDCFIPLISLLANMVEQLLRGPILSNSAVSRPRKAKAKGILDQLIDSSVPMTIGALAIALDDIARLTKSIGDDKSTSTLYAVRDDIRLNHVE